MSLKLRELWNECEKMDESVFNVFVEGLSEIHNKKFVSKQHEKWVGEQPMKPCVAQKANRQGLPPDWTPAEDDLLHKLLTSSKCYADAYRAFEDHPANVNKRPAGGARQRHDKLQREAAKRGKRWLDV